MVNLKCFFLEMHPDFKIGSGPNPTPFNIRDILLTREATFEEMQRQVSQAEVILVSVLWMYSILSNEHM